MELSLEEKYWSVILLPGIAALFYLSHTTGAWQAYVLMLGDAWVLEVVYLQVRFHYRRALVQSLPVGEIRAGDMPRTRVNAGDGELLCEEGRPLTKAQVRRLRELGRKGSLAGENEIELEQAFPLAPFIAAGALLTAVFAGNLAPPLIDLGIWLRGG